MKYQNKFVLAVFLGLYIGIAMVGIQSPGQMALIPVSEGPNAKIVVPASPNQTPPNEKQSDNTGVEPRSNSKENVVRDSEQGTLFQFT